MPPRFRRLLPAALGLALLAGVLFLSRPRPPAPDDPAPEPQGKTEQASEAATPAERPARRHRLADAGWRLVETTQQGEDRRLDQPVALIGGEVVEAPEWYVLVHAVYPVSRETRARFPDRDFTGGEEQGQCGGKLYRLNGLSFAETAAHCLLARDGSAPRRVEICVQPFSRSSCRARYAVHSFAVDASYEADWAAGLRDDRALLVLPEDPGGGAPLPQTPRAEMEAGEVIHVFAMGPDETGALSERVRTCAQEAVDVRRTRVETRATPNCAIRQGDSGSPAGRMVGGNFVQTLIVSSFIDERNFYAPIRPDKVRAAAEVWE
ncbi:hypothetical protein [Neomegalonema sp.]|uniref:hypothetical protein n=1 Tax=Neomegalonema sp. TaxID=2039713 RepID=UPI002624CCED|nr:hypothetical protein [Neomegalonema sp.]MDD2869708.1 hypothetical protein [Neomegalonema sp.]